MFALSRILLYCLFHKYLWMPLLSSFTKSKCWHVDCKLGRAYILPKESVVSCLENFSYLSHRNKAFQFYDLTNVNMDCQTSHQIYAYSIDTLTLYFILIVFLQIIIFFFCLCLIMSAFCNYFLVLCIKLFISMRIDYFFLLELELQMFGGIKFSLSLSCHISSKCIFLK